MFEKALTHNSDLDFIFFLKNGNFSKSIGFGK